MKTNFVYLLIAKFLKLIAFFDSSLGTASCYAMKILGKSSIPVHPKNIYGQGRNVDICQIFDEKKFISSGHFLDVGSGSGATLKAAIQSGYSVTGLELDNSLANYSISEIEKCLKGKTNLTYNVVVHDLESVPWPLPSSKFNVINFTNVLEHLVNRKSALDEVYRLMKSDDSVCLISIPNKNSLWKKLLRRFDLDSRDDPDHKIEYSKEGIADELSSSCLIIVGRVKAQTPSFPINGLFSLLSVTSATIYEFFQSFKQV